MILGHQRSVCLGVTPIRQPVPGNPWHSVKAVRHEVFPPPFGLLGVFYCTGPFAINWSKPPEFHSNFFPWSPPFFCYLIDYFATVVPLSILACYKEPNVALTAATLGRGLTTIVFSWIDYHDGARGARIYLIACLIVR